MVCPVNSPPSLSYSLNSPPLVVPVRFQEAANRTVVHSHHATVAAAGKLDTVQAGRILKGQLAQRQDIGNVRRRNRIVAIFAPVTASTAMSSVWTSPSIIWPEFTELGQPRRVNRAAGEFA